MAAGFVEYVVNSAHPHKMKGLVVSAIVLDYIAQEAIVRIDLSG